MKQTIEIPESVEHEIEAYAFNENTSIEDACRRALRRGATELAAQTHPTPNGLGPVRNKYDLGSRTIPAATGDEDELSELCSFLPNPRLPLQPVTFGATGTITVDRFAEGLGRVSSISAMVTGEWFTITHPSGAVIGRGLSAFIQALRRYPDQLENTSVDSGVAGEAVCILEYPGNDYTILEAKMNSSSGEIESFRIGFLMSGHPVDVSHYREITAQFGLSELQHTKDREISEFSYTPEELISVDPIEKVTDGRRCTGLIIENPLHHHEEVRQSIFEQIDAECPIYENPVDELSQYKRAYVKLNHHHMLTSEKRYRIESIELQDYSACMRCAGGWNVHISVRWADTSDE